MGATNTTANYNLSQFISTDKPAWLQDYNGDMLKIDTGINAAKLAADTAQSTATNAQTDATSAVNSVTTLATTVSSLSTAIGNINGTLNTITSLIGNGTPTTTDHTIIGAINELHADQGDLADLQTTDKSSLVAAINEAAQSGGGGGYTPEVVATGSGATAGAMAGSLGSAFTALSATDKLKAFISIADGRIVRVVNTSGVFSITSEDSVTHKMVTTVIDVVNGSVGYMLGDAILTDVSSSAVGSGDTMTLYK